MVLVPQVAFAASCAVAVFLYALTNIDEIKAKQKVAVERAMSEQSATLKNTQETQRLAIEKVQAEQKRAVQKIKDDMDKRK